MNKPEVLTVEFDGATNGGVIVLHGLLHNAIVDGKIDRNSVYALGRKPEDLSKYTVYADGQTVAVMTRDSKQWTVHFVGEDGETETSRKTFPRTETKRPRRKWSAAPQVIDNGPDLLMVLTKISHDLFPDLQPSTRTGKTKKVNYKQEIEVKTSMIHNLLQVIADQEGKTVEQVAAEKGITL